MKVILILAFLALVFGDIYTPSFKVSEISKYTPIALSGNSTLYTVTLQNNPYDWPVYLLDLHGSRYDMGYDYGFLWGKKIEAMYWAFLENIIGTGIENEVIIEALGPALDWQWEFLSSETPAEFLEEIAGMGVGGHQVGVTYLDKIITRIIVMANAPGDTQDWLYVLLNEFDPGFKTRHPQSWKNAPEKVGGLQCSMFGVWGSRTTDGSIFTARNLDWNKDTGIAQYKLIAVYHPEGKYAHATCGFAGLAGALAGMSSQGLTVHEANLEEDKITFYGFPWVLRLRYIMENAQNLEEARSLWEATNNTVGFNHMVGSAVDAKSMVMETMRDYTAFFFDNDPREANATEVYKGETIHVGFPLEDAVWRTNHGYDPIIRKNYEWNSDPTSWSMERYMFLHDGFAFYQSENVKMDYMDAINITSILGDKGHHAYQCLNNTDGTNVLSVTFHPSTDEMYVAWEDGHLDSWRPASCNTYVHFDMTQWWKST